MAISQTVWDLMVYHKTWTMSGLSLVSINIWDFCNLHNNPLKSIQLGLMVRYIAL